MFITIIIIIFFFCYFIPYVICENSFIIIHHMYSLKHFFFLKMIQWEHCRISIANFNISVCFNNLKIFYCINLIQKPRGLIIIIKEMNAAIHLCIVAESEKMFLFSFQHLTIIFFFFDKVQVVRMCRPSSDLRVEWC